MGMFKKGYSAVREEKQRQDENREKAGKNLWRFFLTGDGDEADVRFLTEEPVTFQEHTVKGMRGGKEVYDTHVCVGDGCSLCASGDKPTFKGAYLIWDMRPYEYTDKDGKKKEGKGQLRLYVQGARVLSQLDRLSSRYGLTDRVITIVRLGKGTSTTYTIEKGDKVGKLSTAEIKNMLPEKLREMYNGTMESLYSIIEEILSASITDAPDDDDEDDDDEEYTSRSNLVGVDDDDEDEEDEEPVKKSSKPSVKKPMFKSKKPRENSVKALYKKGGNS